MMIVLLAIVPLCRRWMTIPLGGDTARAVGGADANAHRPVAAGRVPDGDGHHDYRPAQFCRINGAAYRPYDGLPQDFATYFPAISP